jgi:hypothetical protein
LGAEKQQDPEGTCWGQTVVVDDHY